jgi:hypothetical protein
MGPLLRPPWYCWEAEVVCGLRRLWKYMACDDNDDRVGGFWML